MELLDLNKKEMIQIKAELFTVKKDYEKLDQEQHKQGVGFQKYKTLAKISQDKAKKLGVTVEQVNGWLDELKSIVNFEETNSEAQTIASSYVQIDSSTTSAQNQSNQDNDGFLNNSIRQLETILNSRDNDCGKSQSAAGSKVVELSQINHKQFFDIK